MVPLLRGHYKLAFYHFLIWFFSVALMMVWLVQPLMAFYFNKFYTRALIEEGYYFDDETELVKYAKSEVGAE
jgi:hypothetical protein